MTQTETTGVTVFAQRTELKSVSNGSLSLVRSASLIQICIIYAGYGNPRARRSVSLADLLLTVCRGLAVGLAPDVDNTSQ